MADTQTLLALIDEFPQPFLDPEAIPAPEPVVGEVLTAEVGTGIVRFQAYTGSEDLEEGELLDLLLKDGTVQVWFRHYKNSITGEHSFYRYGYPENGGYISIDLIKGILIRKIEQEEIVAELPPAQHTPELTWREECEFSLNNISSDPELRRLATSLLENLSDLVGLRKVWPAGSHPDLQRFNPAPAGTQQPLPSVWDDALTEFEIPNLPETHARKGSGDCPSGMCPIDH